eukprot:scaffold213_cov94-Cylindrotheca_fusiformis.AAC.1
MERTSAFIVVPDVWPPWCEHCKQNGTHLVSSGTRMLGQCELYHRQWSPSPKPHVALVEAVDIALIGSVPKAWLEKDLQVLVESSKSLLRGMVVDGKLVCHRGIMSSCHLVHFLDLQKRPAASLPFSRSRTHAIAIVAESKWWRQLYHLNANKVMELMTRWRLPELGIVRNHEQSFVCRRNIVLSVSSGMSKWKEWQHTTKFATTRNVYIVIDTTNERKRVASIDNSMSRRPSNKRLVQQELLHHVQHQKDDGTKLFRIVSKLLHFQHEKDDESKTASTCVEAISFLLVVDN